MSFEWIPSTSIPRSTEGIIEDYRHSKNSTEHKKKRVIKAYVRQGHRPRWFVDKIAEMEYSDKDIERMIEELEQTKE